MVRLEPDPEPQEAEPPQSGDGDTEDGSAGRTERPDVQPSDQDDDGLSTGVIAVVVVAIVVALVAIVLLVCCCNGGSCGSTQPKPPPIAATPRHSAHALSGGGVVLQPLPMPSAAPVLGNAAYNASGAGPTGSGNSHEAAAAAAAGAGAAGPRRHRRRSSAASPAAANPMHTPPKAFGAPYRQQQNVNIYDDSTAFAAEASPPAQMSPYAQQSPAAYKSPPTHQSPHAWSPHAQPSMERFDSLAEAAAPALAAASANVAHRRSPSQSPGHHHRGSLTPARMSAADSLYATDQHSMESGASHRGSHMHSPSFVSLFMMPEGHSQDRVTQAHEFLTQHAADRVTVVAEDTQFAAAGPHTLVETLTGTEAAEAMPATPMQVLEGQLDWIEECGGTLIEKYQCGPHLLARHRTPGQLQQLVLCRSMLSWCSMARPTRSGGRMPVVVWPPTAALTRRHEQGAEHG